MASILSVVRDQLAKANQFADIFGPLAGDGIKARKQALRKQYAVLAKMTHPDHVGSAETADANEVFAELTAFHRRALEALDHGVYDERFTQKQDAKTATAKVTIMAGSNQYHIDADPFWEGDFSNLHRGVASDGRQIYVKIATDPTMNPYLVGEATLLAQAEKVATMKSVLPFMPTLLDSVILTEARNEQYRANVFAWKPGFVSLTEVRDAYPNGLDPKDAAWMWRRVLGQSVAANMLETVHGAIVPDHVLVHPTTHEPLHIGWAHAVERPAERRARITTIIDRWRDWYPPEVFAREIPSHQTDLYMAGKTMIYLLGGDVARNRFPSQTPQSIERIVRQCLSVEPDRRPRDGLALMREYTDTVRKLWGKEYRPLQMPRM